MVKGTKCSVEWNTSYEWEDHYANGKINSASCYVGLFRLSVHHYVHCGDIWFASCYPSLFEAKELKSSDIESAKLEALELLKTKLVDALDVLKKKESINYSRCNKKEGP